MSFNGSRSPYGDPPIVRLDTFTFSEDIERDLAELTNQQENEPIAQTTYHPMHHHHPLPLSSSHPPPPPPLPIGRSHNGMSIPPIYPPTATSRYPTPTPIPNTDIHQTHLRNTYNTIAPVFLNGTPPQHSRTASAVAAASLPPSFPSATPASVTPSSLAFSASFPRRLSSSASTSTPSPHTSMRTIGAHFSAASLSGTPAPEHAAFYDDDANYFNLGGSSFPLLPHNSLYESELMSCSPAVGGIGPEKAFSPSGRIHGQHFTSILNQPSSGFLRENATRAVSGATAYLPSLASLWTFTTGVAPPPVISRASEEILAFADESVPDPGPFVLTPHPTLDEKDLDMTIVLAYMAKMKTAMAAYARNHPNTTMAAKIARSAACKKSRLPNGRLGPRSRSNLAHVEENGEDDNGSSDFDHAFSHDANGNDAEDSAALAALSRDLQACYDTVPSAYFASDFRLSAQEFWRDESDLKFLHQPEFSTYAQLHSLHTLSDSNINPYTSFAALQSYHSSGNFQIPSQQTQKNVQTRILQVASNRNQRLSHVSDRIMELQQDLATALDVVEHNLQQQISRKSWLFFSALQNIDEIQIEIKACLTQILAIRSNVRDLKSSLTEAGLGVLHSLRTKSNILALIRTLELVLTVLKTSPTIQLLLTTGDFSSSIQLIQSTRSVLQDELKGVNCVKHIGTKLDEYERLVEKMMVLEFQGLSIKGGNFYMNDEWTNKDKSLADLTANGMKIKLKKQNIAYHRQLTEDEEDRLVPLVSHLLELGQFVPAFTTYIEQLQIVLKQRLMDLVYELLNEVTKDEKADTAIDTKATPSSDRSAQGDSSDIEDGPDEDVPHGLSAKDKVDADSLLSDNVQSTPSTSSEEKEPTITPASAPSPAPMPSTNQASNHVAAPATTTVNSTSSDSTNSAPSSAAATSTATPTRRQAAIAMPVNLAQASLALASSTTTAGNTNPPNSNGTAPTPPPVAAPTPAPSQSPAPVTISTRFSSLKHEQFIALLRPMFTSLMDLIIRASNIRHVATTCMKSSSIPNKPQISTQLNDLLSGLVEYVHTKVGKILVTRAGCHAALPLAQFREFLDLVLSFGQEAERMAGRTFYGLRANLLTQAKAFLVVFHARNMQTLGTALEQEKWVRVDVPPEYQQLIDQHFQITHKESKQSNSSNHPDTPSTASTESPSPATNGSVDPFALPSDSTKSSASTSAATTQPKSSLPAWQNKSWSEAAGEDEIDSDKKKAESTPSVPLATSLSSPISSPSPAPIVKSDAKRVLFVPRPKGSPASLGAFSKFPVVGSLLVLLRTIGEYIECSSQLQAVGSDILNKLVELLQMFNSRSCQLVLGAGAMHLAGLKSITATHLALSSQSVGLIVTQVPVLRNVLATRLPPKHHLLLNSLDRVAKDCQEHQKEIFMKLIGIMSELIRGMVDKLAQAPWTKTGSTTNSSGVISPSPSPSPPSSVSALDEVDECVKTLMKQTCSLHRALSDLLLVEQRDDIFRQISQTFLKTLKDFIAQLDLNKPAVKMKVSYNMNHIINRLRTCTGVDESVIQQLAAYVM